jgi:hypothetical protein
MSDFAYHLSRIRNAGYGWVRLASNDIDAILHANKIGLDVIVVLDIRDAFREFYQAQGEIRRIAAYKTAEKIKRNAKENMKQAREALDALLRQQDPFGALRPVIKAARQAVQAAEDAFLEASMKADQMIIDADREYERFLIEKLDIVSRLDERAFPPGWEWVWKSHIKERIDKLWEKKALVQRYQITNEPNHPYHNWALARNQDLAAKVVNMGGEAAKARHGQISGSTPETMVNLFFRWCNTTGHAMPKSYVIDDRSYIDELSCNAPSIDTLLFDIYPLTWHIATIENELPVLPCYLNRYLDEYHDRWRDSSLCHKPVGIMETGWCTSPHLWLTALRKASPELAKRIEDAGISLEASDLAQVEFFNRVFDDMRDYLSNNDWVKYMGIYEYASTEEWYDNRLGLPCENYFGLNTRCGREKPAWNSVATQLHRLKDGARKKVGITYHV